jgi:hypothetical protein
MCVVCAFEVCEADVHIWSCNRLQKSAEGKGHFVAFFEQLGEIVPFAGGESPASGGDVAIICAVTSTGSSGYDQDFNQSPVVTATGSATTISGLLRLAEC